MHTAPFLHYTVLWYNPCHLFFYFWIFCTVSATSSGTFYNTPDMVYSFWFSASSLKPSAFGKANTYTDKHTYGRTHTHTDAHTFISGCRSSSGTKKHKKFGSIGQNCIMKEASCSPISNFYNNFSSLMFSSNYLEVFDIV